MSAKPLFQLHSLNVAGVQCPSFVLDSNHVITITGPSGCGKTRLIRGIADLDPNDGSMSLEGISHESLSAPDWRRQVMLLPAETSWWADLVKEHFFQQPSAEWFDSLGLSPEVLEWEVARLSSGERQRLGLLRALVNKPRVLLLDEPTANLDEENVQKVEAFLLSYLVEHEAAALWITHDKEQAGRIATTRMEFRKHGWKLL